MKKFIVVLLIGLVLCGCKKKEKIFLWGSINRYSAWSGKKVATLPVQWDEAVILKKNNGLWKVKICGTGGDGQWIDPNEWNWKPVEERANK